MNSKTRLILMIAVAAFLAAYFTPVRPGALLLALVFLAVYARATVLYANALGRAEHVLGIKLNNCGIPFVCAKRAYGGTEMHVQTADLERARELTTCANRCYGVEIHVKPGLHDVEARVPTGAEVRRFRLASRHSALKVN
jgi:hypothetical protein